MSAETPTPHRASADARPSAEAGEVARSLERCNDSRCFSWFDHHRLCEKCEEAALALDRFRAAGVREERERTRAAINSVRDSNIIKGRSYSACWMNACTEIESILSAPEPPP